jgi:hypothetical protein
VRETGEMGRASHRGHGGHRGGWDWWGKRFGGHRGFRCEKQRNRESIAQRSRRSQRGIGIGGESDAVNVRASGARSRRNRESIAQRSQRPQRGLGFWSHPLSDTDTDTSFGRSLTLSIKKTGGTPRCPASHFFRVYFKLEGVSETEIGLNEVV